MGGSASRTASASFSFEVAPELPGADRFSKYLTTAIRAVTSRLWSFDIEGRDNVPTDGPGIITPNHLSFCDSVFVPAALPRRVWAIGKGEYMDSWKTKHLFPAMGMIPVDRTGGDAAQAALDTAAKVLDEGHLFMIYPEGTRSRSGNLHKGRTGAARLAIRCNAPIIPTGHSGTVAVQAPDTVVMKPGKPVTVRFGAPMWAHEYGDVDDPRTLRRFTDAVMFEIAELSRQRYVDTYAGSTDEAAKDREHLTEQVPVTPSRPSVVGSAAPTRPSAPRATPHRNSSDRGEASPIGVPRGRKVPAGAGTRSGDA